MIWILIIFVAILVCITPITVCFIQDELHRKRKQENKFLENLKKENKDK